MPNSDGLFFPLTVLQKSSLCFGITPVFAPCQRKKSPRSESEIKFDPLLKFCISNVEKKGRQKLEENHHFLIRRRTAKCGWGYPFPLLGQGRYYVSDELEIVEDPPRLGIDAFLQEMELRSFTPLADFLDSSVDPEKVYWIRFFIQSDPEAGGASDAYVAQLPTQLALGDLYLVKANGVFTHQRTGKFALFPEKYNTANPYWNFVALDLTNQEKVLCLIRIEGASNTNGLSGLPRTILRITCSEETDPTAV